MKAQSPNLPRRGVLQAAAVTTAASVIGSRAQAANLLGSPKPELATDGRPATSLRESTLFKGFANRRFSRGDVNVVGVVGGSGPPLLLLHGYPETHLCWHKVAPALASQFTVVALDLRGYGDSDKPTTDATHSPYSKREMAEDVRAAMATLGFNHFYVAGHDRGARVAHRLALDHPEAVDRLAVLDMAPTLAMYEKTDMRSARLWFHWFLLIQAADFPEHFIGKDPSYFLTKVLGMGPRKMAPFSQETVAEYVRCFQNPQTIHGICEYYRASAGIDLEHDRADRSRKLDCPVLALWGAESILPAAYDVMELWKEYANQLQGGSLNCGHFLQEELPDEVTGRLQRFFI